MYKAVVLDDDPQAASAIVDRLAASPYAGDVKVVDVAEGFSELSEWIASAGAPDVLFADIRLEGDEADGIQAVRALLPPACGTQVIYVTGFAEYCTSVYDTEHVYFLLKPVDQDIFDKALERAVGKLKERNVRMLPVPFEGSTIYLDPAGIHYVESKLRKVVIHSGEDAYETYSTMGRMGEALPPSFIRCHKSFLVNMDEIRTFGVDGVTLRSGQKVPVGRHFRDSLKRGLSTYYGMR